jgi:acyl transferase domain-containing protein
MEMEASIAAVNGEKSVVLSGSEEGVSKVLSKLEGVSSRKLKVKHAFHSPLTSCILDEYKKVLMKVELKQPKIEMISTVTGKVIGEEIATCEYWLRHITDTVQYMEAIIVSAEKGCRTYVEFGVFDHLKRASESVVMSTESDTFKVKDELIFATWSEL